MIEIENVISKEKRKKLRSDYSNTLATPIELSGKVYLQEFLQRQDKSTKQWGRFFLLQNARQSAILYKLIMMHII